MRWRPALALMLACASAGAAPRLPGEFEASFGVLALRTPAYRGADDWKARYFPVPYIYYRLDRVEVSRGGLRAKLFESDRTNLTLSLSGDLPSNDSGGAREGMPKLLPTFGMGPSLDVLLWRDPELSLRLRLPARVIAATDISDWEYAGWLFNPHLRADRRLRSGKWTVGLRSTAGPLWATREYHDYFYSVTPEFATAERPVYDAAGGYSGMRFSGGLTLGRDRWRYGLFATWDYLGGVAFEDSPLFRNEHAAGGGVLVSYRLWPARAVEREE